MKSLSPTSPVNIDFDKLHDAIKRDDIAVVKGMIDKENYESISMGYDWRYESNLLVDAAGNGSIKMIKYLVECGANIDLDGRLALRRAAAGGHTEVMDWLWHNTDPNKREELNPCSPGVFRRASWGGQTPAMKWIRGKSDVGDFSRILNDNDCEVFCGAVENGQIKSLQWIIENSESNMHEKMSDAGGGGNFIKAVDKDYLSILLFLFALLPENRQKEKLLGLGSSYPIEVDRDLSTILFLHNPRALEAIDLITQFVKLSLNPENKITNAAKLISAICHKEKEEKVSDINKKHEALIGHMPDNMANIVEEYLGLDKDLKKIMSIPSVAQEIVGRLEDIMISFHNRAAIRPIGAARLLGDAEKFPWQQ
ncbi:MAG: Ankyrin repeat (3 copies) [Rickettsiaceae bacterium]|jgi:hypothetical protein|nr:Ankyrin repeat (3 copies) [Rickettsiaceae bacterium]